MAFRIKFKPNRKLRKLMHQTLTPQQIEHAMDQVEDDIRSYWKNNIYDYFDARVKLGYANTGQMGDSLYIQRNGTYFTMFMMPIHNARTQWVKFDIPKMPTFSGELTFSGFSMPGMGFGRQLDTDYGRLMREGFNGSQGAYDPKKDCRVKTGWHPGYDKTTRWDPWIGDFIPAAKQIVADEWMRELKAAGVQIIKPWRVDIHI